MVEIIKHLASSDQELTVEERNLIAQECCLCSPCFVENGFVSWAEGRIKREQGSGFNNQVLPGENLKMGSSPTSPSIFSENWGWTAHLHLLCWDWPRGFSGATPHWKLPPWSGQMAFVLTSSRVWDWMFALRGSLWACSLKAIDQAVTVEKLFTSECIHVANRSSAPSFRMKNSVTVDTEYVLRHSQH